MQMAGIAALTEGLYHIELFYESRPYTSLLIVILQYLTFAFSIYPNIETIFGFVRYLLFRPEQVLGTAHNSSASADFKNTRVCTVAPLLLLCGVVA
jgi:hypothetical protein